jgi:acyl-CoA oxidase
MCYEGIDLIRTNCGGAGFSAWSGLPQQYFDYAPVPTYEGDNTVMAQQTFNYIEKKLGKVAKGVPAPGIFKYLNEIEKFCSLKSDAKTVDQFLDI